MEIEALQKCKAGWGEWEGIVWGVVEYVWWWPCGAGSGCGDEVVVAMAMRWPWGE
jgi:hypothetical protein